jgi:crotonobetainyl-CoA:carnitine CoA-transferase CaiB-like acyl-CoA transferase
MGDELMGVLSGYRILDCSIAMAGPFAAQRLGDLGAEVIKVEPVTGEWQRHVSAGGAKGNVINVSFLSLNRNKKSLAINLKSEEGLSVLKDLVGTADVFLQNYRPGVAKRLGVDYETLKSYKKDLVYLSISGYGETGPYVDLPGQDMLLQAMSGAMMSTGRSGQNPSPSGQFIVDAVTGAAASEATIAALLHRERTGEGQLVTINMLDVITTLQMQEISVYTVGKLEQKLSEQAHGHSYIRAPYGVYATKDSFIAVAFPSLKIFGELISEDSFLNYDDETDAWNFRDEIVKKTAERLKAQTTEYWLKVFREKGLWVGPVYGYKELLEDPQIAHNETFVEYDHPTEGHVKTPGFPYKFSESPAKVYYGAPQLGEHTKSVLASLGYDDAKIATLLGSGNIVAMQDAN